VGDDLVLPAEPQRPGQEVLARAGHHPAGQGQVAQRPAQRGQERGGGRQRAALGAAVLLGEDRPSPSTTTALTVTEPRSRPRVAGMAGGRTSRGLVPRKPPQVEGEGPLPSVRRCGYARASRPGRPGAPRHDRLQDRSPRRPQRQVALLHRPRQGQPDHRAADVPPRRGRLPAGAGGPRARRSRSPSEARPGDSGERPGGHDERQPGGRRSPAGSPGPPLPADSVELLPLTLRSHAGEVVADRLFVVNRWWWSTPSTSISPRSTAATTGPGSSLRPPGPQAGQPGRRAPPVPPRAPARHLPGLLGLARPSARSASATCGSRR